MPNYLQLYQRYYELRMRRYENNPQYARTYAAEKAIYGAIAGCNTLEEFKTRLGNLNELAAIALVQDQYAIRLAHYESIQEPIKAGGCRSIIARAGACGSVQELVTMVNEVEQQTSLAVTAGSIAPFDDFGPLQRYEMWTAAEVPEKYKVRYRQYGAEEIDRMKQAYQRHTEAMRQYQPGWTFDFNRVHKPRHRRLLPYPDAVIEQHITQTKELLS